MSSVFEVLWSSEHAYVLWGDEHACVLRGKK